MNFRTAVWSAGLLAGALPGVRAQQPAAQLKEYEKVSGSVQLKVPNPLPDPLDLLDDYLSGTFTRFTLRAEIDRDNPTASQAVLTVDMTSFKGSSAIGGYLDAARHPTSEFKVLSVRTTATPHVYQVEVESLFQGRKSVSFIPVRASWNGNDVRLAGEQASKDGEKVRFDVWLRPK